MLVFNSLITNHVCYLFVRLKWKTSCPQQEKVKDSSLQLRLSMMCLLRTPRIISFWRMWGSKMFGLDLGAEHGGRTRSSEKGQCSASCTGGWFVKEGARIRGGKDDGPRGDEDDSIWDGSKTWSFTQSSSSKLRHACAISFAAGGGLILPLLLDIAFCCCWTGILWLLDLTFCHC